MVILFLVTSACNGDQIRLEETIQTLESIHHKVPTASIWLLESSYDPQDIYYPRVKILRFHREQWIKDIHDKNRDVAYIKNAIEHRTTIEALNRIPTLYSHIFKISGRYVLTDGFDIEAHPANKATFAGVKQTGYTMEQVGTDGMLMTRLYSFCQTVIPQMIQTLERSEKYFHSQWDRGKVFDIEHGFWKFLPRDILNETGRIGVRGRIGHLSHIVED